MFAERKFGSSKEEGVVIEAPRKFPVTTGKMRLHSGVENGLLGTDMLIPVRIALLMLTRRCTSNYSDWCLSQYFFINHGAKPVREKATPISLRLPAIRDPLRAFFASFVQTQNFSAARMP